MRGAVVIGWIAAACAGTASAQESDARALFEQGVTALDEQRYAEAATLLERSLAIRDVPAARYNRALALRGAGRYLEAITEIARFLEISPTGGRHDEAREAASTMLGELRRSLGTLRLVVSGGAERVELGTELLGERDGTYERTLDPGDYTLRVVREGHAPVTAAVTIVAGAREERSLDASTEPLPAELAVEVDPASAQIFSGGTAVGTGQARVSVTPGASLTLEVRAEGFEPDIRSVTLAPGESARLSIALAAIEREPLYTRWWLWTLVGLAVAGAAVLTWAIARASEEPYQGTLGHVEALRWSFR